MNANTLISNFEVLAEASGGIDRVREVILELATSGKLVDQDENEVNQDFTSMQGPCPVPASWVWTSLEEIANYGGNGNVSPSEISPTDWILDLEDIEKGSSRLIEKVTASERPTKSNKAKFSAGDVLYGKLRPYLDKVLIADSDGYCTTEIVPISPKQGIDPRWLRISLKSPRFLSYVNAKSYGMKMPRLGTKDALLSLHSVPPISEQKRIVAKVDELMALCDQLEQIQQSRDNLRVTTRRSAINAISTATTPEEIETAWKRIENSWEVIADTPESVGSLRSLILDLAVRGRLQNEVVQEFDPVSGLPIGWELQRLDQVCIYVQRGKGPQYADLSKYAVVSQKCVQWSGFDISKARFVDEQSLNSYGEERILRNGDILWNSTGTGTVGRTAIYFDSNLFEKVVADSHVTVLRTPDMNPQFLWSWTASPAVQSLITDLTSGTTNQQELNLSSIKSLLVPVPPLPEQNIIVTKVEELMAICDQLESGLDVRRDVAEKFARSVVSVSGTTEFEI